MTWNLTSIYSDCNSAKGDLKRSKHYLEVFKTHLKTSQMDEALTALQEGCALLKQLESYAACLLAQNTTDQEAQALQAECSAVRAEAETALFSFGKALEKDPEFDQLVKRHPLLAYFLEERRAFAKDGLDEPREELIEALSIDGYHSFWSLYRAIIGKMRVNFEGRELSMGQAGNLLSHPDRAVRSTLTPIWDRAWKEQSEILALILNHLAGFRLQLYAKRGWSDILHEPLKRNRMQKKTLDAMWQAAESARPFLTRYFNHKAKCMGLKKLAWHDLQAPSSSGSNQLIPYDEGCQLIIRHFESWHSPLAAFAKKALKERWVEHEDRPGKQAGGFCVFFPNKGESRIFMTYQNTSSCVATLAHELGHAYHSDCMRDLPYFAQEYRMNVAETASTLAEAILSDAAIKSAKNSEEKFFLLDDKLQRVATFLMNLYARFEFERAFYEERKKGFVSAERLTELMIEAQKNAFADSLEQYSPFFWASKLHFFLTDEPFYNFPYTFGFLLSQSLETKKEHLEGFLKESAILSSEDLAKKHLGVDLTTSQFWKTIVDRFSRDVEEFTKL